MSSVDLSQFAGKRLVVWGNGREGRAAVDALKDVATASLDVIDDSSDATATIDHKGASAAIVLHGEDAQHALDHADVLIKSPGVSRFDPRVLALLDRGAVVTGGSALWMTEHHARTLAVTGSKGKSTTSSLISHLAASIGIENTYGGNIGIPLLDLPAAQQYVLELSSYQCSELTASPAVAVITALFPEHLNWHGSAEQYYADKLNLIAHDPDVVIYTATDERLAAMVAERVDASKTLPVGTDDSAVGLLDARGGQWFAIHHQPLAPRDVLPLLGSHNVANACLALAAVRVLAQARGFDLTDRRGELTEGLRAFQPLPHRLTLVVDERETGIRFVDDSLSTAPQATVAALAALPEGPLVLIVGGQDRGVDYAPLRTALAVQSREVTVIGVPESGPRILAALAGLSLHGVLATDLTQALEQSRAALPRGGTVLLSPAAPSYGLYKNYEARGRAFLDAIRATE
ncbi:MAG TPA: UDP-N-acetylmuramoyl-L-alanine--D-glutamate ligase [Jatrophihabitans sp.]|jgi:UDP-N-acetylmuramoylalanine--D-glutamate ligase